MNCQDALDLLYDIIDREASEIDAEQVKEHLENCRDCFEVYRLEQSVQDFLSEKIKVASSAPRVDELKTKILSRLDDIDREDSTTREPRFFRLTTKVFVAAASLVILIGAAFLLAAFYRHSDLYVPLERAHWAASDNSDLYRNGQVTAAVISYIRDAHLYDVSGVVMNFTLLGAISKEIMGVQMNHLVYHNDERVVSVFLAPAEQFEITSDLEKSRIERNNVVFFDHNCRDCRLVYHRIGSLVVITATTEPDVDLLDFMPGSPAI